MKWYVLQVKSGEEATLKKMLEIIHPNDEIRIFIPKRVLIERKQGKCRNKIRKLLPGYVFAYADMDCDVYYKLRSLPKVYKILKDETEPIPIQEEDIRILLDLSDEDDNIGFSYIVKEGDKINVVKGPLKGYEGIIEKLDIRKKRVKVCLDVLGELKRVDLGAYIVKKVDDTE